MRFEREFAASRLLDVRWFNGDIAYDEIRSAIFLAAIQFRCLSVPLAKSCYTAR